MRARNIKPGFFDNEEIGELSMTARVLFIGLWLMADKNGFLEYRPQRIKAKIFPYDSFNLIKFLEEVSLHGFIIIWTEKTGERIYIEIPKFLKHQRPHPKEKSSNIMELVRNNFNLIKLHEIKLNSRLILGMRILGCSDIRNEDSKTLSAFEKPKAVGSKFYLSKKKKKLEGKCLEDFENFWAEFSFSKGKAEAADSWLVVYSPENLSAILDGARQEAAERPSVIAQGKTPKWAQGWLSGRRWEDMQDSYGPVMKKLVLPPPPEELIRLKKIEKEGVRNNAEISANY